MSSTAISSISSSAAFILGLVVALTLTRIQARSAKQAAEAAASGAQLAHSPRFEILVEDDNSQFILTSHSPDHYRVVKLEEISSANPDYALVPIELVAGADDLGALSPQQQKTLRYRRKEHGAGGLVHMTFRCTTEAGTEYIGYASAEVPGEVVPAQPSLNYLARALERSYPESQQADALQLEEWLQKLNWAALRLCACCYTNGNDSFESHEKSTRAALLDIRSLLSGPGYDTLEQAVIDLASDIAPGRQRVAIYHGNKAKLTPFRQPGWWAADPPILTAAATAAQGEISAPTLLSALHRGKLLYVSDVEHPDDPEDRIAWKIPGRESYKTLAFLPIRAFRSFIAAETDDCLLLGALLLQHAEPDALKGARQREALSLLSNLLGVGIIHLSTAGLSTRSGNGL